MLLGNVIQQRYLVNRYLDVLSSNVYLEKSTMLP